MRNSTPAHHICELIVSMLQLPSVVIHNVKTSSSLKPLSQSKPNFVWSLHGYYPITPKGERKFFAASGSHDKLATMPIYGKKTFKNLLRNQWANFQETWYVASGTLAHHSLFKW